MINNRFLGNKTIIGNIFLNKQMRNKKHIMYPTSKYFNFCFSKGPLGWGPWYMCIPPDWHRGSLEPKFQVSVVTKAELVLSNR